MGRCKLLMVSFIFLIGIPCLAEMTVREEQEAQPPASIPLKYYRFAGGGTQFIGNGIDWSGVGRDTNSQFSKWGTMITSSFYVSANHHAPSSGLNLVFYAGDTTQTFIQSTVSSSQWLLVPAGTEYGDYSKYDLALGRLQTPVTSGYAVYPIYLRSNPAQYVGLDFYMFGIHGTSYSSTSGQKVGRNTINNTSGDSGDFRRRFAYTFDLEAPQDESMARTYDSGAPSFIVVTSGGVPRAAIVRTHWGGQPGTAIQHQRNLFPFPSAVENDDSGFDSMVPFYKTEIVNTIKAAQAGVALRLREVPTFWTGVVGDFDGNFVVDGRDIDLIRRESYQRAQGLPRGYNWLLDLDHDGSIDGDDVTFLRAFILNAARPTSTWTAT